MTYEDAKKWNTACDVLFRLINAPVDATIRAELREEGCCHEFDTLKTQILKELHDRRSS